MDPITGGALIAGASSLLGGIFGNRSRSKEAAKNRQFQERMRNTSWQAAVADMQAAGLNPALAYSQGGAATPGGSMAQQSDVLSPAVSSAMQMRRMQADLKQINALARKTDAEAATAEANEKVARMRSHFLVNYGPGEEQPLMRMTRAEVERAVQQARREGAVADIAMPMAELSNSLGQLLPILGLLSQVNVGGAIKGATNILRRPGRSLQSIPNRKTRFQLKPPSRRR